MLQWQEYCKELAEYYIKKYKPTKLEILEIASKKRKFWLCDGWDVEFWDSKLPYEFTNKQLEKLRSFHWNMQYSMDEIFRWILALTFLEFDMEKDFFVHFGLDSLFWLLNLEYYKRKQKTIFQDYQLPIFDWKTYHFWREERFHTTGEISEEVKKEFENQHSLLDAYCKQVMQIAADAVAYL